MSLNSKVALRFVFTSDRQLQLQTVSVILWIMQVMTGLYWIFIWYTS